MEGTQVEGRRMAGRHLRPERKRRWGHHDLRPRLPHGGELHSWGQAPSLVRCRGPGWRLNEPAPGAAVRARPPPSFLPECRAGAGEPGELRSSTGNRTSRKPSAQAGPERRCPRGGAAQRGASDPEPRAARGAAAGATSLSTGPARGVSGRRPGVTYRHPQCRAGGGEKRGSRWQMPGERTCEAQGAARPAPSTWGRQRPATRKSPRSRPGQHGGDTDARAPCGLTHPKGSRNP